MVSEEGWSVSEAIKHFGVAHVKEFMEHYEAKEEDLLAVADAEREVQRKKKFIQDELKKPISEGMVDPDKLNPFIWKTSEE